MSPSYKVKVVALRLSFGEKVIMAQFWYIYFQAALCPLRIVTLRLGMNTSCLIGNASQITLRLSLRVKTGLQKLDIYEPS